MEAGEVAVPLDSADRDLEGAAHPLHSNRLLMTPPAILTRSHPG